MLHKVIFFITLLGLVTSQVPTPLPSPYAKTGFVALDLDWWPNGTKVFDAFPWKDVSILRIDLKKLTPYMKIFEEAGGAIIRVGGSLQDRITFVPNEDKQESQCKDSIKTIDEKDNAALQHLDLSSFPTSSSKHQGFTPGCIDVPRIKELAEFAKDTKTQFIWGLNALYGRKVDTAKRSVQGAFDSKNAKAFLEACNKYDLPLYGVTLGNELYGSGTWSKLSGSDANDVLRKIEAALDSITWKSGVKPLIMGMDSPAEESEATERTLVNSKLDLFNYHEYILGTGAMAHKDVAKRVLDIRTIPRELIPHLDEVATPRDVAKSKMQIGVGEAGGCWMSGCEGVTNRYISGFWYLTQLALSSQRGFDIFNRQALAGGHYGLLQWGDDVKSGNAHEWMPTPDYYLTALVNAKIGHHMPLSYDDDTAFLSSFSFMSSGVQNPESFTLASPERSMPIFYDELRAFSLYVSSRTASFDDATMTFHLFWHKTDKSKIVLMLLNYSDEEGQMLFTDKYFQGDVKQYIFSPPREYGSTSSNGMKLSNLRKAARNPEGGLYSHHTLLNGKVVEWQEGKDLDVILPALSSPLDAPVIIPAHAYVFAELTLK